MNNKIIIAVVVIIILVGAGFYFLSNRKTSNMPEMTPAPTQSQTQSQSGSPTSATQTPVSGNAVTIQNYTFSPATITVKVGDTVTWKNQDSVGHSATADDGSWDTGVFAQGESKSITFSKAGTYTYHCSVHPMMKGTVIVQ